MINNIRDTGRTTKTKHATTGQEVVRKIFSYDESFDTERETTTEQLKIEKQALESRLADINTLLGVVTD